MQRLQRKTNVNENEEHENEKEFRVEFIYRPCWIRFAVTARGSGDRYIKKSNCFFFTWAADRQYGDKTWISVREHDVNPALNTSLENHRCGTWIPKTTTLLSPCI